MGEEGAAVLGVEGQEARAAVLNKQILLVNLKETVQCNVHNLLGGFILRRQINLGFKVRCS